MSEMTIPENVRFDDEIRAAGHPCFCGVDEAGRGPLAGPVVAAAVILPPGLVIPGVDDSKKLTEKKREALFDTICRAAVAYGIGIATVEEIERYNILGANDRAMSRAVEALRGQAGFALIDGDHLPPMMPVAAETLVKGDAKSASVAAASILAKVSRDRMMREADALYPGYGFAKHKGYGTAAHVAAIRALGPCPIHRPSFLKKILSDREPD